MMEKKLEIAGLTTGYPSVKHAGVTLQRDMHAVLKPGELVCVLGPNGAGKSTLLRTLAGFQKPLAGKVLLNGRSLNHYDLKALARELSVVLTDRFSELYLTAFDVVRMGRFPYVSFFGKMKNEDLALIRKTLESLGLWALQDKLFYNLSDGERQKVLIARALVQDTPFFLLDEPVAFIDSPGRIEIMELLRSLAHKRGKAVLMTTHDMETALHYADFLWLMHRNKPLLTGIPEDLVLQGRVGEYFEHTGLHFDLEKGRFVRDEAEMWYPEIVFVRDVSPETAWLMRALERKGFRVKETDTLIKTGFFVLFEKGNFVLYRNGKMQERVEDIAGVLNVIENDIL